MQQDVAGERLKPPEIWPNFPTDDVWLAPSTTMKRQRSPSSTSSTDSRPDKIRAEPDHLGLSYDEHKEMDRTILSYDHIAAIRPPLNIASYATSILNCIVSEAPGLLNPKYCFPQAGADLIKSNPELLKELVKAFQNREFAPIRLLEQAATEIIIAYQMPFIGDAARQFLVELQSSEEEAILRTSNLYAKRISVVQSSGTGKSRMLTEATGYPPSDSGVHGYFSPIMRVTNNLDMGAHITIASFIAAAHRFMLRELKIAQVSGLVGEGHVLQDWHNVMKVRAGGGF
ncbi:hypothetical protein JB92DRAFT_2835927 [Gautieria morchelliformis]|nr:hypothetical protein JB92DRAFT_2835927 [Gautieria morchelliformis]